MDAEIRALLGAIEQQLERGPADDRFRVAAALHAVLMPGSTATLQWATGFIRRDPLWIGADRDREGG